MNEREGDQFSRRALGLVLLGVLLLGGAYVLAPFFGAFLWAVILAVSSWPLFLRLSDWLGGRSGLSAFLISLLFSLILLVPFIAVTVSASEQVPQAVQFVRKVYVEGFPPPPVSVASWPLIGQKLYASWIEVAAEGSEALVRFRPQIEAAIRWVVSRAGSLGLSILEFALAIIVAGILLANAEAAMAWLRAILERIVGVRGIEALGVAERTIRSVTNGVVGTALVQGGLATVGYAIVGLPGTAVLGFLSFLLAMMQISPAPIWIPAVIWLAVTGQTGWAIFLGVWGMFPVNTIDNFLRPYLIGKGTSLPLVLIFAGVLGGLLAWGFIGIFVGAVLLAVIYDLSKAWVAEGKLAA